jgi:hypothetical protein
MVIFGLFVIIFFVLFVRRRSSWFVLVFFAHSRPNGYFWSVYFCRLVAWVFSPAVDDELEEDPAQISPDTPALSPDLVGYTDRPFLRISYTILERKKKNEEEKSISISILFFFYFFFFKKKNTDFGDVC